MASSKKGGFSKKEAKKFTSKLDELLLKLDSDLRDLGNNLDAFQGISASPTGALYTGEPLWNGYNACLWMENALKNYDHNTELSSTLNKINGDFKEVLTKSKNK